MSSDTAICVADVSKCFRMYANPVERLTQSLHPRFARGLQLMRGYLRRPPAIAQQQSPEFWALQGVSFEVQRGETFGIVGRNGSGKSTLLQIIAGTLAPTTGSVQARGRIAALLELGSGFNPEFTGLENIHFNAAVLGLSPAELDARMDAILGFADIGDFINRPIKTYSSGMVVRLAFAVQAQIDPDILIVDEALAVGDAKFQAKCFARLDALKEAGSSILFVSHSTEQVVTHCDRALLLHDGHVRQTGEPKAVVHTYLDLLFGGERRPPAAGAAPAIPADTGSAEVATKGNAFATRPNYNPYEFRWGDGAALIEDFRLISPAGPDPSSVQSGDPLRLVVAVAFLRDVDRPIAGLTIKTKDGITVYGTNSEMSPPEEDRLIGIEGTAIRLVFSFDCRLGPGDYFISLGIASRTGEDVVPHDRRYDAIHLNVAGTGFFGLSMLDAKLSLRAPA